MEFKTAYKNTRSPIKEMGETITEQCHKNACDVNNILEKYQRTGVLEHRNQHRGEYAFVDPITFQECMETVARAQSMYEELPAHVRQKFTGPGEFLNYVQNPANAPEMVKLGLAERLSDIPSNTIQKDPADLEFVSKPANPDGGQPKDKAPE